MNGKKDWKRPRSGDRVVIDLDGTEKKGTVIVRTNEVVSVRVDGRGWNDHVVVPHDKVISWECGKTRKKREKVTPGRRR